MKAGRNIQVIVVMGSRSDLKVMAPAEGQLKEFGVTCDTQILSAHRTPELLQKCSDDWEKSGVQVIIAGAGGAAHLPGMLASYSCLPVIGVPVSSRAMNGLDALLSVAQMPKGVPVATVAVDNAVNAALLAVEILASHDGTEGRRLRGLIKRRKHGMKKQVLSDRKRLARSGIKAFLSR